MNYLQLCQLVRQECGIQGQGPSSVLNQTGLLKKVVEWVRDADLYVQTLHADWDFLWKEFTDDSAISSDEITKPSDLGMWDRESFGLDRGTADGRSLSIIDFKEWRKNFNEKTNQPPYQVTIIPNNNLRFMQPSDGIYEVYANYWQKSVLLAANEQEPLISERFQRIIVAKAKMYFFEDRESFTQMQTAEKEFTQWLTQLEGYALPGQQPASQGQPDLGYMMVRPA